MFGGALLLLGHCNPPPPISPTELSYAYDDLWVINSWLSGMCCFLFVSLCKVQYKNGRVSLACIYRKLGLEVGSVDEVKYYDELDR